MSAGICERACDFRAKSRYAQCVWSEDRNALCGVVITKVVLRVCDGFGVGDERVGSIPYTGLLSHVCVQLSSNPLPMGTQMSRGMNLSA